MLNKNIRTIRQTKKMTQEELALRLNVVRQTVSKWEQGLSVPDADLLIALSDALETPVSVLLGETVPPKAAEADEIRALAEQLERINRQLADRKLRRRTVLHRFLIALCPALVAVFLALAAWGSPYLEWKNPDAETAVLAAVLHVCEYLFVRAAPFLLVASAIGAVLTRKKG